MSVLAGVLLVSAAAENVICLVCPAHVVIVRLCFPLRHIGDVTLVWRKGSIEKNCISAVQYCVLL